MPWQVKYVVPPFTPGGRVHVAFQFWIPISIGGFAVTGRDLEAALRSTNPTAYITSLFLKHLSANTTAGELLGKVEAPVVEAAIVNFLDWVVPYLHHFTGSNINALNNLTPISDKKKKHKIRKNKRSLVQNPDRKRRAVPSSFSRHEQNTKKHLLKKSTDYNNGYVPPSVECTDENKTRCSTSNQLPNDDKIRTKHRTEKEILDTANDFTKVIKENLAQDARSHLGLFLGARRNKRQVHDYSDGWVTISRDKKHDTTNPTAPLMTRPQMWSYTPGQVQNDRLLWDDDQPIITHNDLSMDQDKRPSKSLKFTHK